MSKYPIVESDFLLYSDANSSDMLAGKGILYTHIMLYGKFPIHLFNTHMQATYPDTISQSRATRAKQMVQLGKFIRRKTMLGLNTEIVIVLGDFNVNAREELEQGKTDSDEYLKLVDILSCRDEHSDCGYIVHDVLRERYGFHRITFGDILTEQFGTKNQLYNNEKRDSIDHTHQQQLGGCVQHQGAEHNPFREALEEEKMIRKGTPRDVVLTFPEELGSQQRLDYIFILERRISEKADVANASICVEPEVQKSVVEPFFVVGQKFVQLSDHYGVSTEIVIKEKE
eukprot:TRINITY_DN378_c0_g1_i6.p1 TRINITY_DN378_c0_g1~~TRINITY_DN378_c0_g1_i6.p1  ORF type:complete len:285 (+),score=42.10 TRINITY_DN378_c0_g1_i6:565-1419(+)